MEKSPPSLLDFILRDVRRNHRMANTEEAKTLENRRNKMYAFMRIPREVERYTSYASLNCLDTFLFIFSFLPMRAIKSVFGVAMLMKRKILSIFKANSHDYPNEGDESCSFIDLIKILLISFSVFGINYVDTSILYHVIKSQSVIKLYLFFNMLEVAERLFSAFGQDTLESLFCTCTQTQNLKLFPSRNRKHDSTADEQSKSQHSYFGLMTHFLVAVTYTILHSLIILLQATTINVAVNASSKSLYVVMMSNNFIEIKGSVFKKFDKSNLFQVCCSDVRERIHNIVLVAIVLLQTMKEYGWTEDSFWSLVPDCTTIIFAEFVVDWLKHAFIIRFNGISTDVYKDYTYSIAYDFAQTKQDHVFTDHSDMVSRRMGFIPIPLAVVLIRVFCSSIQIDDMNSLFIAFLAFIFIFSLRVLCSLLVAAKTCQLIEQHHNEKGGEHRLSQTRQVKKGGVVSGQICHSKTDESSEMNGEDIKDHVKAISGDVGFKSLQQLRRVAQMQSMDVCLSDDPKDSPFGDDVQFYFHNSYKNDTTNIISSSSEGSVEEDVNALMDGNGGRVIGGGFHSPFRTRSVSTPDFMMSDRLNENRCEE